MEEARWIQPGRLPPLPQNMHSFGYPGPKKKYTLCCGVSIAASDQPNLNKGWASASWERKQKIIADHTYFELGMLYYLANDPKVPQGVRDEFNAYGICSDEFQEFGHIPPQLYIRESNRLVSDYVMTQNNIANPRFKSDGIATGHWWLDKHMTGKYAVPTGDGKFTVELEGDFPNNKVSQPGSYDVPYRMLIPKRGTVTNLLVPVCLSASSAAYASTRIETMVTGSAAGVAAKQLVDGTVATVQDVDVSKVQAILTSTFKQKIHCASPPSPPTPPPPPACGSYTVSGAGAPDVNGVYTHVAGAARDGAPVWHLDDVHEIYRYQGQWRIAHNGVSTYYVAPGSGQPAPPASGWIVGSKPPSGKLPAPKVTCGGR